jgi:DNA-binding XRE family transcriptional regulator
MQIFAKRLKWLRQLSDMTQRDVADHIGMSPQGYGKIEKGDREPNLATMVKLCNLFDESSDFLLGITDYTTAMQHAEMEIDRLKSNINRVMKSIEKSKDVQRLRSYRRTLKLLNHNMEKITLRLEQWMEEVPMDTSNGKEVNI